MKKGISIFLVLAVLAAGCMEQSRNKRPLPSLNETFDRQDKKPFGGYIVYNQTKQLLGDPFIENIDEPFDKVFNKMIRYEETKPSLYLLVTKNLILTNDESESMIRFVEQGNDLFIAADFIDDALLDEVEISVARDSEYVKEVNGIMQQTSVRGQELSGVTDPFSYYYYPFLNSFTGYDPDKVKVLGVNHEGKPNYIVKKLRSGRLYLHVAPRSFSNYFLLTANNYKYLPHVLSYLRTDLDNVYWDAYYQKRGYRRKSNSNQTDPGENEFSSFSVIMSDPGLRGAFWVALSALLLFVLFNIKRKQRTIHEIPPLQNNTVAFTETVGRLYLQKKNNKNIAEKMITYFYEYIRNKYFLNAVRVSDELAVSLSGKSGMDVKDTRALFTMINSIHEKNEVDDHELLQLNTRIQNFYKIKS